MTSNENLRKECDDFMDKLTPAGYDRNGSPYFHLDDLLKTLGISIEEAKLMLDKASEKNH